MILQPFLHVPVPTKTVHTYWANKRIALTYEDPKAFDNTPQQREMYFVRANKQPQK